MTTKAKAVKRNECLKERKADNPYEIWASLDGTWQWRVLKKWQADDKKPYARFFCAVKSPCTYGGWEYGDTYVTDVKGNGNVLVYVDPTIPSQHSPVCPRCGINPLAGNTATSRLDNKTRICDSCGLHEAVIAGARFNGKDIPEAVEDIENLFKAKLGK